MRKLPPLASVGDEALERIVGRSGRVGRAENDWPGRRHLRNEMEEHGQQDGRMGEEPGKTHARRTHLVFSRSRRNASVIFGIAFVARGLVRPRQVS